MKRQERIQELAEKYIARVTHTGTSLEKNSESFFQDYFNEVSYFNENPDHCGFYPVKNDHLDRTIPWALLKGRGNKAVVWIHHTDTVDTDDFGNYKEEAYKIDTARKLLHDGLLPIKEEVKNDLESGEWLFGRGISDMKGGGAIQLALLEEYSKDSEFEGNILLLGVPDEENSSAGMRSASYLMKDLKEKYGLDYILMMDIEPHEREEEDKITIYDGSIGKVMPLFLARGKLAHTGQIYTGLNPIHLLSDLVQRTELSTDFVESKGSTTSPGPTWLYMKDRKYVYDVSLPITAAGYMSVLPLTKSPKEIMEILKRNARDSFDQVIKNMKERYEIYQKQSVIDYGQMEYESKVWTFDELLTIVKKENPHKTAEMEEKENQLVLSIQKGDLDRVEASIQWMEYILSLSKDKDPCIVIALAAPYYPAVNNSDLACYQETLDFIKDLEKESLDKFDLGIQVQNYFTGICDLSYGMFTESDETIAYIEDNMLLWGKDYEIPLQLIKEMSMPVFNIGAWGKDLHKYTERVLKEDLLVRIPHLVDYTIKYFLR